MMMKETHVVLKDRAHHPFAYILTCTFLCLVLCFSVPLCAASEMAANNKAAQKSMLHKVYAGASHAWQTVSNALSDVVTSVKERRLENGMRFVQQMHYKHHSGGHHTKSE